jgi:hypothetical protein
MTQQEAEAAARQRLDVYDLPMTAPMESIKQVYAVLGAPDSDTPSPSRDVLAWVVRFSIPMGRWVELTVDDRTGELVRKAHSR